MKLCNLFVLLTLFVSTLHGQTVQPLVTKGDQSELLNERATVEFSDGDGSASSIITIDESTTYQEVDGFGFALTQGSCESILKLSQQDQDDLLNEIFHPANNNVSLLRLCIGASDLSTSLYTYNEVDGDVNMTNFSLAGPDLDDVVPMVQRILAINPNIKILGSPWSAPTWMKTSDDFVGGSLEHQYFAAYALYFVKYIQAMEAQGIPIWAITVQNEPHNDHNHPSMYMSSSDQIDFVNNHLGPAFDNAGLDVKILGWDHNCDNTDYPIAVANGSSYIDGTAFHRYGGEISAMSYVHDQTNKDVYFTEQFTGWGGDFGGDLNWHMQNIVIGSLNNWSKTVFLWNLASSPSNTGYCPSCMGAVTINDGSLTVDRHQGLYIISQMSKYVQPGAVRIGHSSNTNELHSVAFQNPDGSKVLLVFDTDWNGSSNHEFVVRWDGKHFNYTIQGYTAVAFKWDGGSQPIITGVSRDISTPSSSDQITVTANVNSGLPLTSVTLNWGTSAQNLSNQVTMSNSSGDEYTGVIPAQADGSTIYYQVSATDNAGGTGTSGVFNYEICDDGSCLPCPLNTTQTAFDGVVGSVPGSIEAEDFNNGCHTVAFYDSDSQNQGGEYRSTEVDIQNCSDQGGGYNIGWTNAGEFLNYRVDVAQYGIYDVTFRVASGGQGGALHLEVDGENITGSVAVPGTGGWQSWEDVTVSNVVLTSGMKDLKVVMESDGFNLNRFETTLTGVITDLSEHQESLALQLFPNPADEVLHFRTLSSVSGEMQLYNVLGELVQSEPVDGSEGQLNVSELGSGVYVYKLMTSDGVEHSGRVVLK